ncbi:cytochrome p450 [Trifolium pratense]|uniref:Cytochrome p450 n=1 Tax=Trifolium pratense TaxID=57577 RepID=A0A2K3ND23_TRIPR|nr:cytochrome p450 [Trifolium pratense]
MFGCDVSVLAQQAAGLGFHLDWYLQQNFNVSDIIHQVCSREDKAAAGLFAMLIWVLWNNRNNIVWNETSESGRTLGLKARHMWEDWFAVQQVHHGGAQHDQQQQHLRRQKPNYGWYKCNVDAGFHKELNKTSTGWCLRDHMGRFVMAETTWVEGNCSILEGESNALEALGQRAGDDGGGVSLLKRNRIAQNF